MEDDEVTCATWTARQLSGATWTARQLSGATWTRAHDGRRPVAVAVPQPYPSRAHTPPPKWRTCPTAPGYSSGSNSSVTSLW